MSEERVVKRLYQNTAEGSRSVGRPRLRWMDDVREDLRRIGVTDWRIRAHRRDDWKRFVKEAKVLQGPTVEPWSSSSIDYTAVKGKPLPLCLFQY